MRIRLALAAAATLALAACAGDSSTAPRSISPGARANDGDITCRSGYHIATRADGTQYCEQDGVLGGSAMSGTSSSAP